MSETQRKHHNKAVQNENGKCFWLTAHTSAKKQKERRKTKYDLTIIITVDKGAEGLNKVNHNVLYLF